MADDILDSHEQSEQARQWLQQNGTSIVTGILLGLAALLGWQQWQQSSLNHRAEAFSKFESLQEAVDKDDKELASKLVEDLRKNYASSPHAALAALELAELQLKDAQLPEAESSLKFVAENAQADSIKSLASLRLARVQLGRGAAQQALDTLKVIEGDSYAGERDQIRGDALSSLGKVEDARKAYDAALAKLDVAASQRKAIEAKRDDLLAGSAAPAAAVAPPAPVSTPAPASPATESEAAAPAEQG